MKRLAAVGLVTLVALLTGVVFFWPQQSTGPEPIAYGRDTCARCRMHLSQPGFAGELRDTAGVLTKYDDIGCLLQVLRTRNAATPEVWVEDHAGGGFVSLLTAVLVRSEQVDTPMGSGLVAFADVETARRFAAERGGQVLAIEEVLRGPVEPTAGHPQAGGISAPAEDSPSS